MMNRSIARKITLLEADSTFFPGQSPQELLSVHAELNRVALVALGIENAPMRRSVARKLPFREFVAQPVSPVVATDGRIDVRTRVEFPWKTDMDRVVR